MIRRLIADAFVYGIPGVVTALVGLVLLPILTRVLTPEAYGALGLFEASFLLLNLVLPLELSQAVGRFSAETLDPGRRALYFSVCFWFTAAAFSLVPLLVIVFPHPISLVVLGSSWGRGTITLAATTMAVHGLFRVVVNQLRWNLQPWAAATSQCTTALVSLAVTLAMVLGGGLRLDGVILGQLAGFLAGGSIGLTCAFRRTSLRWPFDGAAFREMLGYSAPLVVGGVSIYFSQTLDRWMIEALRSTDEVGIYTVGVRFASVMWIVMTGLTIALPPLIFQSYKDARTPGTLESLFAATFLLASVATVAAFLFVEPVVRVVAGAAFVRAAGVVPYLMASIFLFAVAGFSPGLSIGRRSMTRTTIAVGAAVTNLVLNGLLLPVLGIEGAAAATLASSAVLWLGHAVLGQRHYVVPYRWTAIGVVAASAVTAVVVGRQVEGWGWRGVVLAAFVVLGGAATYFRAALGTPSRSNGGAC